MITLRLTKTCIADCTHRGDCTEDVDFWLKNKMVSNQLDKIDTEAIRKSLKEFGSWDSEELLDDEANRRRFLWCVCGFLREEGRCTYYEC